MTRRLILMRHAKSSWGDPMQDDHDRPLNARGRASAAALGDWLRGKGYVPDEILCSSAARTLETCDRLRFDLAFEPRKDLYLAHPVALQSALAAATGQTVLMIAHNPSIATFAAQVVSNRPDHERFIDYPTGATLVVEFEADAWSQVRTGRATDFVVPHDLLD